MNDFSKVLSAMRQHSSLHALAESGATPAEMKALVLRILSPYFSHPDILERFGLAVLVPNAVMLSRLQGDPWAESMLLAVLDSHRAAFRVDETAAITAYCDWEPETQRGLSRWWSSFHLELDKTALPFEHFVHEASRNMGTVIEACAQPLLRELLHVMRIGRCRRTSKMAIAALEFGVVVGELIDTSGMPELFQPPPWGVRISQWRNMCQHFSLVVDGESIVGTYGPADAVRSIVLTRQGLLDALQKIVMVFDIVKQARTIFVLDNIARIGPSMDPGPMPAESGIVCLASAIATQGFEIRDIRTDADSLRLAVRDVTNADPKHRMLHASQFVAAAWYFFPCASVTVVYEDKTGRSHLTTVAKGEDCQKVSEDKISVEEFANRVQLIPETG
jgi:hypothetical protein